MNCPNCEARIADGAQFCPNCGCDFEPSPDTAGGESVKKEKKPFKLTVKMKVIIITAAAILLVWVVFFIIILINGSKGERTARKLADGIGSSGFDVVKGIDCAFLTREDVSPDFLNDIEVYNWLCKSEDTVKISGVFVPEWVIYCTLDEKDKITGVKYYDFSVIEKNWKGEKTDSLLSTKSFETGMTIDEVCDKVDFDPISINYTKDKTVYDYRYYCLDIDKNERSYSLTVEFNESGRLSSVSSRENDFITFFLSGAEDN